MVSVTIQAHPLYACLQPSIAPAVVTAACFDELLDEQLGHTTAGSI